jgi:hypothetical protein
VHGLLGPVAPEARCEPRRRARAHVPDADKRKEYQGVFKVAQDTRYLVLLNCSRISDGTVGFEVIGPWELLP